MNSLPHADQTAAELQKLAHEYAAAATFGLHPPGKFKGMATAPFRVLAIHAIELALDAVLLHNGESPKNLREYGHDLAVRLERALLYGLELRSRTAAHIIVLTKSREYLIHRYDPGSTALASPVTRLNATLVEVKSEVERLLLLPPRRKAKASLT